jgi:hypothetical protein
MNCLRPLKRWVMGSNPNQGMDVCVRLFCVWVVLCVGWGLATGWSPVQGVLPAVYRLRNIKNWPRYNKRLWSHNRIDISKKYYYKISATNSAFAPSHNISVYVPCLTLTWSITGATDDARCRQRTVLCHHILMLKQINCFSSYFFFL